MKKRILSILLSICMVLSFVPTMAFAEDPSDLDILADLMGKGGTVKLDRDYTISDKALAVERSVTLDLNGHVIRLSGNMVKIWIGVYTSNVHLTIKDSNPNAKHDGLPGGGVITGGTSDSGLAVDGGAIYISGDNKGKLTMDGGTIYNCRTVGYGGGVVNNGTFIMNGGTIENCSAKYGGGVASTPNSNLIMNGGTIKNCSSSEFGGGVMQDSPVTINGGTIENCRSDLGGGVFVHGNGDFTINGGTIENCSATTKGGGVFVANVGRNTNNTFAMNGGAIRNCSATTKGGGVSIEGSTNTFKMTGGVIENCTAIKEGDACFAVLTNILANGGDIHGTVYSSSSIKNTSPGSFTKFYDEVTNFGTISGGVYYGGIQNKDSGTVTGTCYKVSFDSNGGSTVPTQWFVNVSNATALNIKPTRGDYEFRGWYNGNTTYNFTKPVTGNITLTAKWALSSVSTEAELRQAINEGASKIKLVSDIKLTSPLNINDKVIVLDLNGHVLSGDLMQGSYILLSVTNSPSSYGAILTLKDSNPTATHTGSSLPFGGVLDCAIGLNVDDSNTFSCTLNADGGTVTKMVSLNHTRAYIRHTSGNTTPTAFKTNVSGAYGSVYSGIYYGYISENLIKGNTVTFKNGDDIYAREIVSNEYVDGSSKPGVAVAPIEPVKDGYVFAGWYNGSTKYDFTQTVTSNITLTAKWVNAVTSEETLRAAINEGLNTIKLMNDIKLSSALDLSQKNITIDLNGYVISGADISINTGNGKANLTLIDSRPNATHTDSTLPLGGVVTSKISMKQDGGGYNDCVLYANGGTVTSEFNTNTNTVAIKCTSNTPTAFTGKISGYTHLYGGIYYGTVNSSVTFEESKITFKNGDSNYAYEVLSSDKKSLEPISPLVMTGYQAFDGWYNGNTKYTFGSALSEDITLTAKFSNPKTYNISYDLDGGTATNPTSYTVESDAITLNNPVKTGYTFTGWSGTGLTGENNMAVTIPKDSTGDRAYTAHFSQNSYTVTFNTIGGSGISDKTGVKWTDTVLSGITAPTKDGWEFTGWKCGDMTVNANTKYSDLAANDTVTSVTLVAQWKDIAVPTGEISIGTNKWNSFLNTITFGLFFKDTQTVTITASDNSGDAVKIEYLLSDKVLSETELVSATFTAYTDSFSLNPDNKYVVYARLTDTNSNATYINSEGVVLDATTPVIPGVENGKTYCEAQTVTVTEEYIESVKVNGTAVTLNENNQFMLNPAEGTQTIVVTDKAGNVSAEITVTINDGHTYEWQSENSQYWKKCKFCGDETAKKDIPTITINGADSVCITQDYKFSFTLPEGATDAVYGYEFENKGDLGFPVIIENNEPHGVVSLEWYEPSENSFKVYAGAKTADGFEFFVSKTVQIQNEHAGGVATCVELAICDTCGEEYGELDSTNHNLEKIPAKAATVTETGNEEYWHCKDCGKYFADENGTNEIKLDDTVIAKLPPEIIEGKGQSITVGEKKELTFRSNAAFSDFIRVRFDGKTLDEKNYTATEGSTVVTLKADYVATLSAGEHTIGIVSESGTATTAFIVNAKAVVDNDTKSPKTGDNSPIALWIALLFVSGGAIATTGVRKKKKHSNH